MPLIKNTIVFLDTGFFKNYKEEGKYDPDFLEYSRKEKIILLTSHLCLEEWRSQKVKWLEDYLDEWNEKYDRQIQNNPIANEILGPYPLRHPDPEEINEKSQKVVNEFVEDNKIIKYMPTERHIERTWTAYFRGLAPFKWRKNKNDIPDSWIFEAAKDIRFDEEYKDIQNRFCIGGD